MNKGMTQTVEQHRGIRGVLLVHIHEKVDKQRPIDCVEQTYLACRDSCMWHAKFRRASDVPDMRSKEIQGEEMEDGKTGDEEAEDKEMEAVSD
jgi:hypothetical protein